MFRRFGIIILILFCALQLQPARACAAGPPVSVLVVPFEAEGADTVLRRHVMDTFAVPLHETGARIVGIDALRDAMLKRGVTGFSETEALALAASVKADYVITGAMIKDGGILALEWRVTSLAGKEVIAAYAKSSQSEAEVLRTLASSARPIYDKMVATAAARPAVKSGLIDNVEVSGTVRIDKEAVLKKLISKPGAPFSIDDVREDIKAIYATGYFDDVSVDLSDTASGKALTFIVREMPFIKRIAFKGNSALKDEKLNESVTLKENTVLDRPMLEMNAEKIKGLYAEEGYYLTTVKPVVNSDGVEAAVTFDIDEGPEVKIKRIVIIGADHFSESRIKGFMTTSEKGIFSALSGSGKFNEQKFMDDLAVIMGRYYDDGYIAAEILDHRVTLSADKKWFYVSIAVSEGIEYRIGRMEAAGDIVTTEEDLLEKIKLEPGDVFNRTKFSKGLDAINDVYGDKGYAYADIRPITDLNAETGTVDITLDIKKNELTYIERVDITGNVKTLDKVIRREIELGEGDLFSSSSLKRSRNNLRRTGYFEDVQIKDNQGSGPDKLNLNVGVKERPTGSISAGIGYSSVDKLIGTASIAQTNFLGTGIKLDISGTVSASSSKYIMGFTEPWLFDTPVSAGFDIYSTDKNYDSYKLATKGFDIRTGFPVTDRYTYGYLTYRLEEATVGDVNGNAPSDILERVAGSSNGKDRTTESSIKATLKRDTRDDAFFPSEGSVLTLSTEVASGVLGGSNRFVKYETDNIKFFPFPWETTFSIRASAGYVQGYRAPDYDKFYLGGINSLRGFRTRSVGPHDTDPARASDPKAIKGGNTMILASFEYLFPVIEEQNLKGVLFFDIGNAYDKRIDISDLRKGAGVGLRWFSPIGPLRLEYGVNLDPDKEREEKKAQWEFTVGTNF